MNLIKISSDLQELARDALDVRTRAYAPYSKFLVGAAVRSYDGRIFTGANVENVSYGLTICAERNAVMQAVIAGASKIIALAVAADTAEPVAPCGMCRQVLAEFAPDCVVVLVNLQGEVRLTSLSELLPEAFASRHLS